MHSVEIFLSMNAELLTNTWIHCDLDLIKRSAGKVTCPQQCAVTPRGSRPLFY
jgi:hypothetical protein